MSKLVVTLLVCVLIVGGALYAVGKQLVPAVGDAGTTQRSHIQSAFQ